jgi:hypothetical protein
MFIVIVRCVPDPDAEAGPETEDVGGAYVSGWIDFKDADGAVELTKFYIEESGWLAEELIEVIEADRELCDDEDRGYFDQAAADGYCLVFSMWPIDAVDADIDYDSELEEEGEEGEWFEKPGPNGNHVD